MIKLFDNTCSIAIFLQIWVNFWYLLPTFPSIILGQFDCFITNDVNKFCQGVFIAKVNQFIFVGKTLCFVKISAQNGINSSKLLVLFQSDLYEVISWYGVTEKAQKSNRRLIIGLCFTWTHFILQNIKVQHNIQQTTGRYDFIVYNFVSQLYYKEQFNVISVSYEQN